MAMRSHDLLGLRRFWRHERETPEECGWESAGPYESPVYPPAQLGGGGPHATRRS
jgi:hypothetical protein